MTADMDAYCRARIGESRHILVPWWLMAAWAYEQGEALISDALFDELAARLAAEWDAIEHRHKALIDRGFTKSALGFTGGTWPTMVRAAASRLLREGAPANDAIIPPRHPDALPAEPPQLDLF